LKTEVNVHAFNNGLLQDSRNCGEVIIGPDVNSCTGLSDNIGGSVFEDLNYDGLMSLSGEKGVAGIWVYLFDDNNEIIDTAITDLTGNFLFDNLPGTKFRIEFYIPESINCWAKPSLSGVNGNSMVHFTEPGDCINLGLADPSSFCGTNLVLATTCFVDGEPLLGGSSGEGDVLVTYPYKDPTSNDVRKLALNKHIGTAWGLAYDKNTKDFFAGAMLKRHAGFGPLGIGGIYKINYSDPANPIIENWLKLSDIGVDVGTDPRNYALPMEAGRSNTDPVAFSEVAKISLGDVDLSEDGKTLYAMNLNNNGSLLIIDVASKNLIAEVAVNNPGCSADSDVRPWGIEVHNGSVYIGVVCSGQSGNYNDFNFFVLELTGNTFTEVFSSSLDYPKGGIYPKYNETLGQGNTCKNWESWTDDFSEIHSIGVNAAGERICRPQPILSDLEFDKDGSIILAFMDRTGHQTGYNQYSTTDETVLFNGYIGGDILRLNNNNGQFELEDEGTTANGGGCGLNGEGPGGGEFYCGENYKTLHLETSLGAIANTPSDDLVALNVMDPFNVFSGGTAWLNNLTGQREAAFELYNSHPATGTPEVGTFGKAAGLGDLELICETAPIEIGNLVWEDSNGDGFQNSSEKGIDGIEVELVKNGMVIARTTTSNGGQYYFILETVKFCELLRKS